MPSTDTPTFKSPSHPSANALYPAPYDFMPECVEYETGDATQSVSVAVEAYDPDIHQQTGYHVV